MQVLNTHNITEWPEAVILGYSGFKGNLEMQILSPKEKEKFAQFTNEQRKSEYLTARHLFRFLLNELKRNPKEVKLLKEEKGKPYAEWGDQHLYVSFSHSRELAMCAISLNHDIGLDIETTDRIINQQVVKRILNENEWHVVGEEDPIKLWTIKEAAVKSLGTGLRTNLKDLTIHKEKENKYSVIFNDDKSFEICSFQQLNHQIALAY